ncbi:MAG: hypothetical protein RBT33_00835 [Candidatus Dojkabacteria bacterium]|jgi:hypothetical protein|nr:hypothetical protein [Candidatus Dojkabacteria bacterium]MDX9738898.1 hypothetical protein [Candidatus Dojkabacteria bacterium]
MADNLHIPNTFSSFSVIRRLLQNIVTSIRKKADISEMQNLIDKKINKVAIVPITITLSNPVTTEEVQEILDKVNEIISKLS